MGMSLSSLGSDLLGGVRDTSEGARGLRGRFDGEHILVPLLTPEVPAVTDQIEIAATLARVTGASLSVVNPVSVPEQTPKKLRSGVADADDGALLDWVLDQAVESTARLDGGFLYARDVVKGVLRTARTRDVDTLVLPSGPYGGRLRRSVTERIAIHADCDVVVVNGRAGYESVASILLPIAGGPHSGLATDFATCIAADCGAWIDVLHVVETDATGRERETAEGIVDDAYHRTARPETTTTWVLEADDAAEAIVEQSRYYGLTIVGAPTTGRLRRFIHGSTNRSVRENAGSVVLSARNNSSRPSDPG